MVASGNSIVSSPENERVGLVEAGGTLLWLGIVEDKRLTKRTYRFAAELDQLIPAEPVKNERPTPNAGQLLQTLPST